MAGAERTEAGTHPLTDDCGWLIGYEKPKEDCEIICIRKVIMS